MLGTTPYSARICGVTILSVQRMLICSATFLSCRTLPGHLYEVITSSASGVSRRGVGMLYFSAVSSVNFLNRSTLSRPRSLKAGILMLMVQRR